MSRRGERQHVERGISRDQTGYAVRVSVGTGRGRRSREHRFAPAADLPYLRAQRAQLEADLRDELQHADAAPTATPGTFARDVQTYLKRVRSKLDTATWKSRASELAAWVQAFGTRPRHSLRLADVERALRVWQHPVDRPARPGPHGRQIKPRPWTKPSDKTVRNRVVALKAMFHTLDGKRARTPADDLALKRPPKAIPRAVDRRVVRTVIARLIKAERRGTLHDAKTRARFLVLVTCGQRPSQVMRTDPETDVDLARRVWWVPAGKGGNPIVLPLNDERLAAWQLFVAAKASGPFESESADPE